MAARTKGKAKFYVYRLNYDDGRLAYIGKGSGTRLRHQITARKLDGVEIARFWREDDAFSFEADLIMELNPPLNLAPGGLGGCVGSAWASNRNIAFDRKVRKAGGLQRYVAQYLDRNWEVFSPYMDDPSWDALMQTRAIAYPCSEQRPSNV